MSNAKTLRRQNDKLEADIKNDILTTQNKLVELEGLAEIERLRALRYKQANDDLCQALDTCDWLLSEMLSANSRNALEPTYATIERVRDKTRTVLTKHKLSANNVWGRS